MKLVNQFKSVGKIDSRFPNPFAYFVTLLMKKVFQFLLVDVRIKDLEYFKIFFAINFNWRWRCL